MVCANNARFDRLPPRELIAADPYWRVAHAFGTRLPGWLVLLPRRHVTAVAELTDAEAAALGIWQVRLSRALHAVTGCVKTYVAQFAEAEGFGHVHFHIIARSGHMPAELRGPKVFTLLGRPDEEDLSTEQRDELALQIREHLGEPSPSPMA
ncbi:Diadenosine tetraphosphate (Ap4A) hydrolase [Thermomonospora echinospora]|uniref:Diadenosine tetraphosphate (Ap4A) hydrolase n=1 Tax=Thermomonospora echinospora TaxID=1992 RepID=A0A1H6AK22_9ACTN|nr:HIT domain-containing protein [Thermomonospora echinospora]SEG48365.1 Diadenosine tetraphosphate (Ap4A) hydrolase [Thermomonospora echinospora]